MKRLLAVAGALLLAATLTACGTAGAGQTDVKVKTDVANIVAKVEEAKVGVIDFTLEDVQLASDDAHAHDDRLAYMCWDYVLTILPKVTANTSVAPKGVASTFQHARDLVRLGQKGVSDDLKAMCGPLYLDAKDDVKGIAAGIAGIAVKLGIKGFSGGLL